MNFFFDKDDLFFRAIIVGKAKLNHGAFQQTHDNFYYKIYFRLLERMMDTANQYRIYLDLKDTQGHAKLSQLKDFLCNSVYDFSRKMVAHIYLVVIEPRNGYFTLVTAFYVEHGHQRRAKMEEHKKSRGRQ